MSKLIPFPPKHVRPEQVGHIVDFYDQNLSGAAMALLDEAFATGGRAVVARLTARLFVSIGATYGESTLLEVLDEMAAQQDMQNNLL